MAGATARRFLLVDAFFFMVIEACLIFSTDLSCRLRTPKDDTEFVAGCFPFCFPFTLPPVSCREIFDPDIVSLRPDRASS